MTVLSRDRTDRLESVPAGVHTTAEELASSRRGARRRPRAAVVLLVVGLVAAMACRVLLGTYTVTIPDFFTILSGGTVEGAGGASFIVLQDKLPHAVLGALAGLALGCSGAVFQLLLRNPLASPDIIGINASASLGAVSAAAFFGASGLGLAAGGLVGAVAAAVVVFVLSVRGTEGNAGNRFVLVGLGIAVLAVALTNYLLSRMSIYQAGDAAIWLSGSLGSANWTRIALMGGAMIVLIPLTALVSRNVHALAVGEDLAAGLGVPVAISRWAGIALAVVSAAVAVAMTGPISFVAFVSGPVARKIVGGPHHLTASALVGGIIVVLADFVAGNYIPGGHLPVGVVTGIVGAPVLLWLVASAQKERS